MPTYSVTIANDGGMYGSYPSGRWTMVLTKGDGTTVTASAFTTYSDIVSMQITGLIYQHDGDGGAAWYDVVGQDNTAYILGGNTPDVTTYNLNLT